MATKVTHYKLLPTQYKFAFGYDKSKLNKEDNILLDVSLYQGGFTCLPADAEFLSPTGWKRIDTLTKGDKLAVYYDNGRINYEHPLEVFRWDADKWYEFKTRTLEQKMCPNHRVITWTPTGHKRVQSAVEFYDEHNRLKQGHLGKFRTTFELDSNLHCMLSKDELRFLVAYQADGTLYKSGNRYNIRFHLSKQRKVDRLIELIKILKYNHKVSNQSDGDTCIYVDAPKELLIKEFPREWYNLNSQDLKIIIDEIPHWDGTIGKTHNSYYTNNKANADFIQFAGSASGFRTTIFHRARPSASGSGKMVEEYRVNFNTNTEPSLYATRNKTQISVYNAKPNEYKYCPSTSTGMWVARYNGKIVITGNSGKTFVGSLRGLCYALKWAGCKGLVGAASQDLLDNTTKAKYLEHMANMGLKEDVHWWYTDRKNTIVFLNGSTIRFKTLSDWAQFRSTEFTWVEIEEASLIDEKTFKELIARVREQKREEWVDYHRSIFLHTNPQGARGWMYKFFHNPKTKIPSYRAVIASTRENHHLGTDYVENLEGLYSADEIQELLEGIDVDNDSTVAFPYFNAKNIRDEIPYNPNYPLILSCDFNYNPMCWYLMQHTNEGWLVLKELIFQNITTKEMCKIAQIAIDECKTKKLVIMGDSHGRDRKTNGSDYSVMIQYFSGLGYDVTLKVQKANPRIKERLSILRSVICNGKMQRKFFVDSSCERLIYNFNEAKNNLANGGLKEPTDKEIQEDINKIFLIHPIDAISYPIYYTQRIYDTSN